MYRQCCMYVSPQCTKHFHIGLSVWAHHSSVVPVGQTALPHFTEKGTQAWRGGAGHTVPWSEVMEPRPEISPLSCSPLYKGL